MTDFYQINENVEEDERKCLDSKIDKKVLCESIKLINQKAEEFARIDPISDEDRERKKHLRWEIYGFELSCIKQTKFSGKAVFPLMPKKFKSIMEVEDFNDVLSDLMFEAFNLFDPDKSKFTTFLAQRLPNRMIDKMRKDSRYWNFLESLERDIQNNTDWIKQNKDWDCLDDKNDKDKEEDKDSPVKKHKRVKKSNYLDVTHYIPISGDEFVKKNFVFDKFCCFATIVGEAKKLEKHLNKSKRRYFEGFFTFDTCRYIEVDGIEEDQAKEKNDLLFPVMELVMLEYLKVGTFLSMHDVIMNELDNEDKLKRRNDAMCVCYDLTKPTVVKKNKLYLEQLSAI